jgi:hypothetical protein
VTVTRLFLRSRRAGWTALYLAAIAVFTAALRFALRRGDEDYLASSDGSPVTLALVFVPLAAALVIGVGAHGPFGEVERTGSRPLPPLRLGHLVGLLLWAAAALALLALTWEGGAQTFLRNLAGLTGIALIAAPLTGARLSWVLPFSYGILAYWTGTVASGEPRLWAWPMRPEDDGWAMAIAIMLLAAGLTIAALFGAREGVGDAK